MLYYKHTQTYICGIGNLISSNEAKRKYLRNSLASSKGEVFIFENSNLNPNHLSLEEICSCHDSHQLLHTASIDNYFKTFCLSTVCKIRMCTQSIFQNKTNTVQ